MEQLKEFQLKNCKDCKWADTKALKTFKACCTKMPTFKDGGNECIRRNRYQDEVDALLVGTK